MWRTGGKAPDDVLPCCQRGWISLSTSPRTPQAGRTADQDLSLQLEALRRAGCRDEQIFYDTVSGARTARPGLDACLQALASGTTLVV
jgi:DNA invertase Pin-like site-specific DNA recombinase